MMSARKHRTVVLRGGAVAAASGAIVGVSPVPTHAAPDLLVTNSNDAGPGSLREAVLTANLDLAPDVIVIDQESTGPGFVTAWTAGIDRPATSTLNLDGAGQTIANAALLGVDEDGTFDLYAQTATHLVVDLEGYFLAEELTVSPEALDDE